MTATHRRMLALIIFACASLIPGCSKTSQPTATQPGRVAQSLTVSGMRPLIQGETVALVATVRWSTGAAETVSGGVSWTSDDSTIASVDQHGVVTAVAAGDSRIRAVFTGVSATAAVTVTAAARTVSGTVHESFPTELVAIAGATVTATDAAGGTQSAVTDAGGRFALQLVSGVARVAVSAPGYDSATTQVNLTSAPLSLALSPQLREVRESFDYIFPQPPRDIGQRVYRVNVHHAGEMRAGYTNSYASASAQAAACLEVRDAANAVLAQACGVYDNSPRLVLSVAPGTYEVKFYVRQAFGVSLAAFSGEMKHPS